MERSPDVPFTDQIRPESREIIQRLHAMGIRNSVMLTGDNAVVARAVGRRLGLSRQFADMLPADKAEVIQQFQREGNVVAMVGDGINDSPALSFADVGIAMKHGAEVARESADVVLMEDLLWKLVKAVEISRGAVRLIHQNYAIVAGLNTLALGLALPGGLIIPEITALISNGSAILASLNGIRPICVINDNGRAIPITALPPLAKQQALRRAILNLENQDFAAQLADYAGRPIYRAMRLMPKAAAEPHQQGRRSGDPQLSQCRHHARSSRNRKRRRRSGRLRCSPASAAASRASSGSPRCRSNCR